MQMMKFLLAHGSWKTYETKDNSKSKPEICMLGLLGSNKQQTATSFSILSGFGFVCEKMEGEDKKNSTSKSYQEKIIGWRVR